MAMIVAIEGLDGTGKTALAKAIQRHLRNVGVECVRANFSQTAYARRIVASDTPELRYLSLYAALHQLIAKLEQTNLPLAIMDRYIYSIESYYSAATHHGSRRVRVLGTNEADIKILLVASLEARTERITSRKKAASRRKLATLSKYGDVVQAAFNEQGPWARFDTTSGEFGMIAEEVCTKIIQKWNCTHAPS